MKAIPYSPRKVDLFYPARSANFFLSGLPDSESALCAEMSRLAYSRREPYFQFDQEQIRAVLKPLGFSCQFFESSGTPEGMGTHAFLAVHDDPEPALKLSVLSFRGTDAADPTDLAEDAEFLQCKWPQGGQVHRGFSEALAHVFPSLQPLLDLLPGRVLFTGHSLGAAIATLLASIRRPDYLCTFGSPRVGNADFVATLNGVKNHRFVDCCDIVARIPPESVLGVIKYAHSGMPFYIDRNRTITQDPPDETIDRDRWIASGAYVIDYAWRIGNVAVRELADHAIINYVTAVSADASQPQLAKWALTAAVGKG